MRENQREVVVSKAPSFLDRAVETGKYALVWVLATLVMGLPSALLINRPYALSACVVIAAIGMAYFVIKVRRLGLTVGETTRASLAIAFICVCMQLIVVARYHAAQYAEFHSVLW